MIRCELSHCAVCTNAKVGCHFLPSPFGFLKFMWWLVVALCSCWLFWSVREPFWTSSFWLSLFKRQRQYVSWLYYVTLPAWWKSVPAISRWLLEFSIYSNIVSWKCPTILATFQGWFYLSNFYRAMHFSAKRGIAIVCCPSDRLSVCPCVTFRYRDHIGWNSWKIISRPNSLGPMWGLTPTWAIWCNGNTPKIRVEERWTWQWILRATAVIDSRYVVGTSSL